jgi:hypothetical protein
MVEAMNPRWLLLALVVMALLLAGCGEQQAAYSCTQAPGEYACALDDRPATELSVP